MTAEARSPTGAPGSRDTALLFLGASLLTSSYRRSEASAVDHARRTVLQHVYQWRRRARSASSGLEAVIGAVIVAYAVLHLMRRGIAVAEDALGIDIGLGLPDDPPGRVEAGGPPLGGPPAPGDTPTPTTPVS